MTKTKAELEADIQHALQMDSQIVRNGTDVTDELLKESSYGPGAYCARVAKAKPAKELTPTLAEALSRFERTDRTMGFVSKPLAYSHAMPRGAREHSELIRLVKGGYVKVYKISGKPPSDSTAQRDSPYGVHGYYVMKARTP